MEAVQLLPSNMSHSLQLLISLSEKARHNRSNCNNLVGQLKFLKPLFDDIEKSNITMIAPVLRELEALDSTLNKANELVERCGPKGSNIYMVC